MVVFTGCKYFSSIDLPVKRKFDKKPLSHHSGILTFQTTKAPGNLSARNLGHLLIGLSRGIAAAHDLLQKLASIGFLNVGNLLRCTGRNYIASLLPSVRTQINYIIG